MSKTKEITQSCNNCYFREEHPTEPMLINCDFELFEPVALNDRDVDELTNLCGNWRAEDEY